MDAPSQEELELLESAGRTPEADLVMHWQSAFGLIIIETRVDCVQKLEQQHAGGGGC